MKSTFAVVYCHISITSVCHYIDTNTITNKEIKDNVKVISFSNNTIPTLKIICMSFQNL